MHYVISVVTKAEMNLLSVTLFTAVLLPFLSCVTMLVSDVFFLLYISAAVHSSVVFMLQYQLFSTWTVYIQTFLYKIHLDRLYAAYRA